MEQVPYQYVRDAQFSGRVYMEAAPGGKTELFRFSIVTDLGALHHWCWLQELRGAQEISRHIDELVARAKRSPRGGSFQLLVDV